MILLSKACAMEFVRSDLFVTGFAYSVLTGVLLFASCQRKPRVGRSVTSWRTSSPRRKVYGVDEGSAYLGRYGQGSAIIIWTDLLSCGFPIEATWDRTRNGAKYAGYVKSPSGLRVNVECFLADRMKGSMQIDQHEYDLADGSLFLISFRSPQIRVGQVNQDIYATTWAGRGRKQLVEDIPEIRDFFEAPPEE